MDAAPLRQLASSSLQTNFVVAVSSLLALPGANTCGLTPATAACGVTISGSQAQCCLNANLKATGVTVFVAVLTNPSNLPALSQSLGVNPAILALALSTAASTGTIGNSIVTMFVPNYGITPSTSPRAAVGSGGVLSDAGSIAGVVIGAVFLASAVLCIFCLCTRRLVWRWAPTANGESQSLEVVCIPRDGRKEGSQTSGVAVGGGGATAGTPARGAASGASMVVRDPAPIARTLLTTPPSPAPPAAAPAAPAAAAVISTPKAFLEAAAKGSESKAVLAALAATPSLAQSVDEATGITAVMKAIRGKDVGVVKAMLAAFPSGVNVADKNGATPLHHAVVYQNLEIISVLVGAGADLSARDIHGETQVELARKLLKQGHHRTDLVVKALEAVNN